jgi:putative hydrolase of the HAD superfamily
VRAVVFDIDDTLYLERDYIRSGFIDVGQWLHATQGVIGFAERAFELHEQGVRGTIFDRVLNALDIPTSGTLIAELVARYRAHTPKIALLPDAERALSTLVSHYGLAAVSDGPIESQSAKVIALKLERFCRPIVLTGAYPQGFGKPHPRAFREVETTLGHQADECLYIADNPSKDFSGPKSCGWRTLRVRRSQGLYRDLPHGVEVDHVVEDLDALPELISSIG